MRNLLGCRLACNQLGACFESTSANTHMHIIRPLVHAPAAMATRACACWHGHTCTRACCSSLDMDAHAHAHTCPCAALPSLAIPRTHVPYPICTRAASFITRRLVSSPSHLHVRISVWELPRLFDTPTSTSSAVSQSREHACHIYTAHAHAYATSHNIMSHLLLSPSPSLALSPLAPTRQRHRTPSPAPTPPVPSSSSSSSPSPLLPPILSPTLACSR